MNQKILEWKKGIATRAVKVVDAFLFEKLEKMRKDERASFVKGLLEDPSRPKMVPFVYKEPEVRLSFIRFISAFTYINSLSEVQTWGVSIRFDTRCTRASSGEIAVRSYPLHTSLRCSRHDRSRSES